MARTEKIAVTVDREVLGAAERLRQGTGESRSALVNRALLQLVMDERQRQRVERYVQAYREQPETENDAEVAAQLAAETLSKLPW
jgi:metal-responsive CopG/Arc/MetJ family transcriptional regulator